MEKDITKQTIIKKDDIEDLGLNAYISYFFDVNEKAEKEIDEYFESLPKKKTVKLLIPNKVERILKDCINKPKGVIPNSVYEIFPNFKF